MAQDGPKMAPKWPHAAQDWQGGRKMAPRTPRMAPRWPRGPQDGSKMAPRWLQCGSYVDLRWAKHGPRMAQDGPKCCQICMKPVECQGQTKATRATAQCLRNNFVVGPSLEKWQPKSKDLPTLIKRRHCPALDPMDFRAPENPPAPLGATRL